MEDVTLGMTDLKLSRIAFGAWELGGGALEPCDPAEMRDLHHDKHHAADVAGDNAPLAGGRLINEHVYDDRANSHGSDVDDRFAHVCHGH
jgi:aryl-alcohol dehydrogenase-like predicted oxidoreductase